MVSYLESFLRRTNCAATPVLASMIAALFLAACEHQNEGAATTGHMTYSIQEGKANLDDPYVKQLDKRFFLPTDAKDLSLISTNDAYSVHIISAFICDFHEISNPFDFTISNSAADACHNGSAGPEASGDTGTRGEIAMLANVFERDGIGGQTTRRAGRRGAGRVVYYNTDVRESGQMLNALNIPVHGPISYNGNPLFMELAILELDNQENEKTQQMLTSLASLGAAAYPPSGKALDILTSVSSVFLSGNQDDTEMRFQIEFDRAQPGTTYSQIHRMPLSEGYIAFLRSEDRSENLLLNTEREWEICPSQGIIAEKGECEKGKVYRKRTWVLVRISKEDPTAASLLNVGEDFATFTDSLSGTSDVNVTEIQRAILTTHGERMAAEVAKLNEQIAEARVSRQKEESESAARIKALEAEREKLRKEAERQREEERRQRESEAQNQTNG